MLQDQNATTGELYAQRLLDRAGFGSSPGQMEKMKQGGPKAWLDRQLEPAREPQLERSLKAFPSLEFSTHQAMQAVRDRPLDSMLDEASRMATDTRQARRATRKRGRGVVRELAGARIVRAVHTEYPLQEVMLDFWSNHFSVFGSKAQIASLLPEFERKTLAPRVLGRFEDLLIATAQSPAMLVYLDNWMSSAERTHRTRGKQGGINENYARELLELHTLGVDGGYSQEDIIEVAKTLTGWTLVARDDPRFEFRGRRHARGKRRLLGQPIAGEGMEQGLDLLSRLARHPATAQHLSRKLTMRFVSDDPPPNLVERTTQVFLDSGGRIDQVVRSLLESPEFRDPAQQKYKTPLRFAVSAIRAGGGSTDGGEDILIALDRLGEVPWMARTPAGHPEAMDDWLDPNAALERMSFAFELAHGGIPGTQAVSPGRSVASADPDAWALKLAAPEFQWS